MGPNRKKVVGFSHNVCATVARCIVLLGYYHSSQGLHLGEADKLCFSSGSIVPSLL